MTKYLLQGWEQSLTNKINEECDKHKEVKHPEREFKSVWYYVWVWVRKEIDNGDMIKAFTPFAESFCRDHIESKLKSYKIFG